MIEDAELLRRYAEEGSEEAFAELVQRHLGLVYFGALRRTSGDVHLAADVSQSVFIQLARNAPSLRRHPVLSGWLFTTTRNTAINARVAEERRRQREQEAFTMHESSPGQGQTADWDRLQPLLLDALDELPEQDRAAVLLRFFSDRAFAEVGRALHVSEEAARKRVDRALEKMHAALGRRGVTSTTAALAVALTSQATAAVPPDLAATVTQAACTGAAAGTAAEAIVFMNTGKITAGVVGLAIALGLSLIGNAYLLRQDSRPPLPTGPAQAVAMVTPTVKPMLPHELVKNADLVALRDQIRAAGNDEATVHAVLEGILYSRYRQKLSDNRAEREQRAWWTDIQRAWGTSAAPQLLNDEPLLIRQMVTDELAKLVPLHPLELAAARAKYGFLPPELQDAFIQVGREEPTAWAMASSTGRVDVDAKLRADLEKDGRASEQKYEALIASLTPVQRAEYDLRFSPFAIRLQQQLLPVTLTEQEYRAVFPLAEAYTKAYAGLSATDQRGAAKNQLDRQTAEKLVATFGYDRALDLVWGRTLEYPVYERVAREADLPANTAGQVAQLAAETADQAAAVHADATLNVEQKQAALVALQQKAQSRLDGLIPPAQQQQLTTDSLFWLTQLGQGRYKPIVTSLPGQSVMMFVAPIPVTGPVPSFLPFANLMPARPSKN